jgi:phage/plasmid-like protein (TIGR03299 family)
LAIALGDSTGAVKVPHRSQFNAQAVKRQLGIAISSWDGFMARMRALSECKVNDTAAETFLRRVLTYPTTSASSQVAATNDSAIKAVHELFTGRGKGADMASAAGTAWGLLNSVTEFVDHHRRARSDQNRTDSAWFGTGAALKQKAFDEAMRLVA